MKRLRKKFRSLDADLKKCVQELQQNPFLGTDLGNNMRKVRMQNSDKQTGKSGGYRIVTYYTLQQEQETVIYLVEIWDKSERESIETDTLRAMLDEELG